MREIKHSNKCLLVSLEPPFPISFWSQGQQLPKWSIFDVNIIGQIITNFISVLIPMSSNHAKSLNNFNYLSKHYTTVYLAPTTCLALSWALELHSNIVCGYINLYLNQLKLNKIKILVLKVALDTLQVLNHYMWLVATKLHSTDTENFLQGRKFSYTELHYKYKGSS